MGTETALMNYIDHLQNELNNSKYAVSVFMDLSKAFDVIDHKILESKSIIMNLEVTTLTIKVITSHI